MAAEERMYDEMPYRDDAYFHSQPARLAATALLLGLRPPPVETARILELGCASGGNLIPLALRYPASDCVGIDLSGVQIDFGRQRIAALGLKNIRLEKASILDVQHENGRFDYIIAHGVFSWVPADVRSALLRIMQEQLTDNGIVYMSYNVLPGWQLKRVARDIMLYAEEGATNLHMGVTVARSLLETIAQSADGSYAQVLQAELAGIKDAPDSYLRHDHMEPVNAAMYFRDVVALASSFGLQYLMESDPVTAIPECVKPESAALIRQLGAGDQIVTEQYLDYCIGRAFRMSVFVKDTYPISAQRVIQTASFPELHFSVRLPLERVPSCPNFVEPSSKVHFVTYKNARQAIVVQSSIACDALDWLIQADTTAPGTFTLAQLLEQAQQRHEGGQLCKETLSALLLELLRKQMIYAYAVPIARQPVTEKPCVDRLVREDALAKKTHTVNRLHENVRFEGDTQRQLVGMLDGTQTQTAIVASLTKQGLADAEHVVQLSLARFSQLHLLAG